MKPSDSEVPSGRDLVLPAQIDRLTGKTKAMGIIEQVKQMKLDEARAEARKEAKREEAEKKNRLFVTNLLMNTSFSVEKIAVLAGVSEAYVNKVKTSLKK
jgi:hypothetical protein